MGIPASIVSALPFTGFSNKSDVTIIIDGEDKFSFNPANAKKLCALVGLTCILLTQIVVTIIGCDKDYYYTHELGNKQIERIKELLNRIANIENQKISGKNQSLHSVLTGYMLHKK